MKTLDNLEQLAKAATQFVSKLGADKTGEMGC